MHHKTHHHTHGFTVLELGVGVVVIALLLASVLIGQELIRTAKMHNIINQLESYDSASGVFFLKYKGLPGDIRNAEAYELSGEGDIGESGNGDGRIGADTQATLGEDYDFDSPENFNFWFHLARAGLVEERFDGNFMLASSVPQTVLREVYILSLNYVWDVNDGYLRHNGYLLGLNRIDWDVAIEDLQNIEVESRAGSAKLLPVEAQILDQKRDDGNANTGMVRNIDPFAGNCHTGGIYRVSDSEPRCALTVSMRGAGKNRYY